MGIQLTKIKRAFRKLLLDVDGMVKEDYCSWEGELFEPPEGKIWIKEAMIPISEQLVASSQMGASGIYQVSIFGPLGSGLEGLEVIRDAIKTKFRPTNPISATELGIEIAIDKAEATQATITPSVASADQGYQWLTIIVSIYWRNYAPEDGD